MRQFLFLASVLALLIPLPCPAQEVVARAHLETGLTLAAEGDTAAALQELEKATSAAPDLADAHYHLGRLLARSAGAGEAGERRILDAQRELLRAIDLDPSNTVYLLEYSELRIPERSLDESEEIVSDALERLAGHGHNAQQMADLEYELGAIMERDYERFRDRRMVPPLREPISTVVPANLSPWISDYVERYMEDAHPVPGMGESKRERMVQHYRTALQYQPTHWAASTRLLLALLEDYRIREYLGLARRLVDAHPDRPEALLYLGLGLHAAALEDEAGAAFDSAVAAMPEEVSAPFLDLAPVMRRGPAETYAGLDEPARQEFETVYWRLNDPLYLTEANERRLEHMSRVAYADLRFREPSTGRPGWATDRGIIFIRYGPPDRTAGFGVDRTGNHPRVWTYNNGLVFIFRQTPGLFRARFAGDYQWVADEARLMQPSVYENIPSIPMLAVMPIQIARFRGPSVEEIAVEIHAELPLERLAGGVSMGTGDIQTGIFLLNTLGETIVREVDSEILQYAEASTRYPLRSWRLLLPASGKLVAAVEARDAVTWRAAAARDTFTAEFFPEGSLSLSDILLADDIRVMAVKPLNRTDFDIAANPSLTYTPNQPVVIYYELYGLDQDAEGFASYEVSLAVTVKSVDRSGTILGGDRNPLQILGVLADAWGFSPVGDDRLELRFRRELDMKDRDRANEYHSLDLQRAPAGEYEITLKVWDELGQQLAERTRRFRVVRDE